VVFENDRSRFAKGHPPFFAWLALVSSAHFPKLRRKVTIFLLESGIFWLQLSENVAFYPIFSMQVPCFCHFRLASGVEFLLFSAQKIRAKTKNLLTFIKKCVRFHVFFAKMFAACRKTPTFASCFS